MTTTTTTTIPVNCTTKEEDSTQPLHHSSRGELAGHLGNSSFRFIGDAMNYANIAINILLTTFAMLGLPSKDSYDDWWVTNGFCVDESPSRPVDTEVLCFLVLAGSSLVLYYFNQQHHQHEQMNPQLRARLAGAVFGNAAHGFGHLFLFLLGAPPLAMSFAITWEGIGNSIMTFFFFVGVFKALLIYISTKGAVGMAVVVMAVQYALNVPPGLVFTYSQSVIVMAAAVDQLFLPSQEKGFTYLAFAASYLPVMILYVMEMTICTDVLSVFGGHSLYDLYLSAQPFLLFYIVRYYEKNSKASETNKAKKL